MGKGQPGQRTALDGSSAGAAPGPAEAMASAPPSPLALERLAYWQGTVHHWRDRHDDIDEAIVSLGGALDHPEAAGLTPHDGGESLTAADIGEALDRVQHAADAERDRYYHCLSRQRAAALEAERAAGRLLPHVRPMRPEERSRHEWLARNAQPSPPAMASMEHCLARIETVLAGAAGQPEAAAMMPAMIRACERALSLRLWDIGWSESLLFRKSSDPVLQAAAAAEPEIGRITAWKARIDGLRARAQVALDGIGVGRDGADGRDTLADPVTGRSLRDIYTFRDRPDAPRVEEHLTERPELARWLIDIAPGLDAHFGPGRRMLSLEPDREDEEELDTPEGVTLLVAVETTATPEEALAQLAEYDHWEAATLPRPEGLSIVIDVAFATAA